MHGMLFFYLLLPLPFLHTQRSPFILDIHPPPLCSHSLINPFTLRPTDLLPHILLQRLRTGRALENAQRAYTWNVQTGCKTGIACCGESNQTRGLGG